LRIAVAHIESYGITPSRASSALVYDLQQIRTRHAVDRAHAPAIEIQHVDLGQLEQLLAEGPAAVPNA